MRIFPRVFAMIEAEGLRKSFGPKQAVRGVSFKVNVGEVLGFLGPNGAGKSTSMRMVTGFLEPDSGSVRVDGYSMASQPLAAKARLGYLPENAPAYPEMAVGEFLSFCGEVRGLSGSALRRAVESAIERCFLGPVRHQTIETLSKGYRHRVGLAQAILHDPPALVLDEPTDGLDPNQKHEVRQLIREMGKSKAIVFSTHILEEVEAACTRAIIIDRGEVVANGSPAELKARAAGRGVLVHLSAPEKDTACRQALESLPQVARSEVIAKGSVRVAPKQGIELDALSGAVIEALAGKFPIVEVKIEEGRLDEVFRSITTADAVLAEKEKSAS